MYKTIFVKGSLILLGIFILSFSSSVKAQDFSNGEYSRPSYEDSSCYCDANENEQQDEYYQKLNEYYQLIEYYEQLDQYNQLMEYYQQLNEYYQSNPNYYDQGNGYYNSNDNLWRSEFGVSGNYNESTGEGYILFDDGSSVTTGF